MPTATRGGGPAAPPARRQPPVPIRPDDRAKPALAGPMEPPHPALQAAGFNGGIQEFNDRVQAVVDAHRHGLGRDPTPGVVLDVVRSPLDPSQYQSLFNLPLSNRQARLSGVVASSQEDSFVQRPDGLWEPDGPFRTLAQTPAVETAAQPPMGTRGPLRAPATPANLQAQHPWVASGFLPVHDFPQLIEALKELGSPEQVQQQIRHGQETLQQYQAEVAKAGNPALGKELAYQSSPEYAQAKEAFYRVKTVKDAQHELNGLMGTSLPESGFINQDWAQAISDWTKTTDYFRKTTKFLADQNGLSVPDFVQAWRNQQELARKHPLSSHLVQSLPLRTMVHPNSFWGSLTDLGSYLKGGGWAPWNVALHGLTRTTGLTLDVVGGTVSSAKADAAAANAFAESMTQHPMNKEQALAHARKVLHENPSWLRVVDPGLAAHPKGWLKAVDSISNVAVDLIVLRKPGLTGETVAYGDVPAALRSSYLHVSSGLAYDYLKGGKLGRAASMLEGGAGAEKLATAAEPLIKRGLLSPEQFKQHLAELYANGETTLAVKGGTITVRGPALDSLRTARLTTPGQAGQGWKILNAKARDLADRIDQTLHANAATDTAATFLSKLRAEFSHAVAPGKHSFFDPRLPERIHDWTLGTFGDAGLANKWESDFVRARAHEDIPRMQAVFEKMRGAYHDKFPVGAKPQAEEPFQALLGTEAPSLARFPSGGQAESRYLGNAADAAKRGNQALNYLGKLHARIIVSGAPFLYVGGRSLFYKHMVADTLRRYVGGGFLFGKGLGKAKASWEGFLRANPELERSYGAFLDRTVAGETRWLLNRGQAVNRTGFQTGERFGQGNYMQQAGAYVRRMTLDDAALDGYLRSKAADLTPLTQAVLHDRELRGMWKTARKGDPTVTAEAYAERIWNRYESFRAAAEAAGVQAPFDEAMRVIRSNRGPNVDKALGSWVGKNKIDFEVTGAQVTHEPIWDSLMNGAVQNLMVANKWNRGGMARNVFLHHWNLATKAGIEPENAARIAMSVAERQTVYHMLDFANRLKIEQDLRWFSYFATKHRLYWKWLMGTFLRRPGVAAAVYDTAQHLDSKGQAALPFRVFGMKLDVPVARLFWVPGKEYTETSPAAGFVGSAVGAFARGQGFQGALQAAVNSSAGTNGNVIGRSDQAITLGVKLARVSLFGAPATYGGLTAGLDAKEQAILNRQVNEFQVNYMAEHGHYAPESEAVKHVLLHATAESWWRSNLPFPVIPAAADRTGQQKLMAQFMAIDDPKKRREFMDAHPGFTNHFGVYDDPRVYLRNREYFGRYTKTLDEYRAQRQALFAQAQRDGFTPEIMSQKRALDAAFQQSFDEMLVQDAHESGIHVPAGQVPNGHSIPYGKWGKLVEADPLLNPQQTMKALFPHLKPDQYGHIYGALQKDLTYELRLLGDPEYAGTFDSPEEVKTRKREILSQLEVFRSYPKDALGRVQADYILNNVNPYWKEYERRYQQIRHAARTDQDALKASFYAWREQQDHGVTVDGIKFPSPARMAWATLDPQTRSERLAYLASANWDHLTDYEKQLLGTTARKTAQGWVYMQEAKDAYKKQYPGESIHRDQLTAVAKEIDKVVPGFYHDYLFAQQPLIRRYEAMGLYRELPSDQRVAFDQYIGAAAKTAAGAIASGNYNSAQIRAEWVNYIDKQVTPWLNDPQNAPLRKRLEAYGPNFLHSLIEK